MELAKQVEEQRLSVRKTEEAVRAMLKPTEPSGQPAASAKPEMTPHVLSLQDDLRDHLAAKVDIRLKRQDAGQIVIHFGANDDFERIVGRLRQSG